MAYVYRHIRLDKNQPFYIGIGLKDDNYARAYNKSNRTKFWKTIAAKGGFEVEILFDNLTCEQAKEKEKEFITLYGKKQCGGLLVNLTNGGDGTLGYIHTEETRKILSKPRTEEYKKKLSVAKKGIKLSQQTKEKMRIAQTGRKQGEACKEKLRNRVFSEETRAKISMAMKGRVFSEESKIKMQEAQKGKIAWNKGKNWTEETKAKMRRPKTEKQKEALRKPKKKMTCPHCGLEGGGGNMKRYHFNNCKYEAVTEKS